MLSLILWSLAPVFNAVMDLTENENYVKSIFSKFDPKFWYKRESWDARPEIPVIRYTIDAWHIAKTICFGLMTISGVMVYYEGLLVTAYHPLFNLFIEVGIRCIIWGVVFELFYSKIFRLKNAKS